MTVDERSFRVDGRTAVVTGAGSGIGRAAAGALARAGAAVVVADINVGSGEATAAGIAAAGGRASFVRTDVSRRDDLEAAVERAVAEFGGLDIMCNIAGVPAPVRALADRIGEPEDQALLVLYLVSDAARFVTGQVVRANGGWSMP